MNYLKWNDFDPTNYQELDQAFAATFKNLLPTNSKASFKYHVKKYRYLMVVEYELKKTFIEELERFSSYLIITYNLK